MLRAMLGFDHCPRNVADTWIANSGHLISRYVNDPANGKGLIIDSNAKLTTVAGTSTARTLLVLNLSQYMVPAVASSIVIGYRTKLETAGGALADWALWVDYGPGTTAITILNMGHIFGTLTAGTEAYIEIVINLANGAVEFWKDGVMSSYNATLLSSIRTQLAAGNLQLVLQGATANTPAVVSYRDFYVLDDVPGDGFTSRLGPRVVRPLTLDAVPVSTGWTPSNAQTPLEVLNAAIDVASPGVLTSSAGAAALEVSLKSNIPANTKVEAIQLMVGAQGETATSKFGVAMKDGSATTARRTAIPGTALKYGVTTGCWARSPSGKEWDNTTIDNTSLVITPDL